MDVDILEFFRMWVAVFVDDYLVAPEQDSSPRAEALLET